MNNNINICMGIYIYAFIYMHEYIMCILKNAGG